MEKRHARCGKGHVGNMQLSIHAFLKPTLCKIFQERLYASRFEETCRRARENLKEGRPHNNTVQNPPKELQLGVGMEENLYVEQLEEVIQ